LDCVFAVGIFLFSMQRIPTTLCYDVVIMFNLYILYTWSRIEFFVLKALCYYSADISGACHQSC
jgi:hypothetical protein